MLRGGSYEVAASSKTSFGADSFNVSQVDLVGWLISSFSVADFVVLKLDVEGAEADIVPALLSSNASRLVDVLLWECHMRRRGNAGRCRCLAWEEALRANGVRYIYRDPYPFKPHDFGPVWFESLPKSPLPLHPSLQ